MYPSASNSHVVQEAEMQNTRIISCLTVLAAFGMAEASAYAQNNPTKVLVYCGQSCSPPLSPQFAPHYVTLGATVDTLTSIPTDLAPYKLIFVMSHGLRGLRGWGAFKLFLRQIRVIRVIRG